MARATAIPILKPAYKLDPGGSLSTPDCRHGPSSAWPTLATPLRSSHSRPRHKHVEPRSRYRREFAAWPAAGNSTPVRIRYRLARHQILNHLWGAAIWHLAWISTEAEPKRERAKS